MAHLSWYRKYRPQTFADVVGQTHIERTLRNAVSDGTVAHAYLFTGPRGTGKTTTARILAKALDCEQGPTPTPDDTCEQCRAIANGTHPDVLELDAASRRGIDDVREQIIGRVKFAPSIGKWKVYIIDEVHMLTREAFNALLKTFEEPPPNTVFVLCTTDPHKVPETIHSRCQRFDFHRLSVEDIAARLRFIADAEGVTVPDGALALIGRHSLGGMRDAITTLEQLASFGGGSIQIEDVEGLLGEVDQDLVFRAAEIVLEREVADAFRLVANLAEDGVDMSEFVKAMVRHFRDLFVVAAVGTGASIDTTATDLNRLESQAVRFGADRIARVLELLGRLTTELRYAPDQRLALEIALTRMARPQGDITLESLAERLDALEAGAPIRDVIMPVEPPVSASVKRSQERAAKPVRVPEAGTAEAGAAAVPEATAPASAPEVGPAPDSAPARARVLEGTGKPGALDPATVKRAWPAVLAEFKKIKPSRSHLFSGTEAETDGEVLTIEFAADQAFTMELAREADTPALLRRCVRAVLGVEPPIEYRLGRSGASRKGARPEPAQPAATQPASPGPADSENSAPQKQEAAPAPVQDPAANPQPMGADIEAQVIAALGAELMDDVTPDE